MGVEIEFFSLRNTRFMSTYSKIWSEKFGNETFLRNFSDTCFEKSVRIDIAELEGLLKTNIVFCYK